MSLTLIREERITQTGSGLQLDADLYIKLDTAFDELVAELGRGGQLPALIHIYLREAYASSGQGNPATLKTIAHAASCKERQAQRIVKSLLAKSLIAEAGMSPLTGEKFYRALGYAWFGNNRAKSGVSQMTPQNGENGARGVKCHPPVPVVDDVAINNYSNSEQQQQHDSAQTRGILQKCGVMGKPLNVLSENVLPETASAWAQWLKFAPSYLRNPVGILVSSLLADPDARPALPAPKEPTARKRNPTISGKLAALSKPPQDEQ